ncbi:hypothetical protein KUV26_03635 [Leisingera daeponensis]|uniref:Uncharacterized protein n=1 Tax=Leisingera daeponensis TaxID=405746 RepID=A0ABS7NCD8_9RHOB|nr:hypothetical protein [Leisingera daeponensis]MBY6138517.1 hypothetical protein [Leisingera daeponensis]
MLDPSQITRMNDEQRAEAEAKLAIVHERHPEVKPLFELMRRVSEMPDAANSGIIDLKQQKAMALRSMAMAHNHLLVLLKLAQE